MPLPRLFIPFGAGVLLFIEFGALPYGFSGVWIAGCLLVFGMILSVEGLIFSKNKILCGCLSGLVLCLAGYFLAWQQHGYDRTGHFRHHQEARGYLLVQIDEPLSERVNSFQTVAEVLFTGNDSLQHPAEGRLMLYFEKDSLVGDLQYGDRLILEGRYSKVSPPQNPEAFNYQRFLARQNIFHSMYVRSGEWLLADRNRGNTIMRLALFLRQRALDTLADNHLHGRDFAVISALLLGYREYLDEDLRREFAGAGAMHILCVSGLHVGIIFMVLSKIFSFLHRIRGGHLLKAICILLCIWFYAAITGFSPSVQRASVMFSFVSLGQSFQRPTNIYNTLAASAFVLVASDPAIIKHIGFQLSYLAVISIVSLQPWFEKLITVRNILFSKAWAIITVSLAAQLATGPLALHYFNQFPNYFLLTNLAVIPLASLVIYGALISLALSSVPVLGSLAGQCLAFVVRLLHHSVSFIEGLPGSVTTGVYISFSETLLFFIFLVFLFVYLMAVRRGFLLAALGALLLMSVSWTWRASQNSLQRYFVVYHVNRETAVDFTTARQTVFLASAEMVSNERQKRFTLEANRLRRGSSDEHAKLVIGDTLGLHIPGGFQGCGDLICFHGLRILVVHDQSAVQALLSSAGKKMLEFSGGSLYAENISLRDTFTRTGSSTQTGSSFQSVSPRPFRVDYLLVSGDINPDMSALLHIVHPGRVLLDGSIRPWRASAMEETLVELGVDVWNTHLKGAYVRELR